MIRRLILTACVVALPCLLASPAAAQWGWRGMARRQMMWNDMMQQGAAMYGYPAPGRVVVTAPGVVVDSGVQGGVVQGGVVQGGVVPVAPSQVVVRWGWGPGGLSYSWGVQAPAFEPQLPQYVPQEQTVQRPAVQGQEPTLAPPVIEAPSLTPPGNGGEEPLESLPAPSKGPIEF
jgi:hypothetical protein